MRGSTASHDWRRGVARSVLGVHGWQMAAFLVVVVTSTSGLGKTGSSKAGGRSRPPGLVPSYVIIWGSATYLHHTVLKLRRWPEDARQASQVAAAACRRVVLSGAGNGAQDGGCLADDLIRPHVACLRPCTDTSTPNSTYPSPAWTSSRASPRAAGTPNGTAPTAGAVQAATATPRSGRWYAKSPLPRPLAC